MFNKLSLSYLALSAFIISISGDCFAPKPGQDDSTPSSPGVKALLKQLQGKIPMGSTPPPSPQKKTEAPPQESTHTGKQFNNLNDEQKLYGVPKGLNLDTLYKMNPDLWTSFQTVMPESVLSQLDEKVIKSAFANFMQEYALSTTYDGSPNQRIHWVENSEGLNWQATMNSPMYNDYMNTKLDENNWTRTDLAHWIQEQYVASQSSGATLPWLQETTTTTTSSPGGGPPPPPPPPGAPPPPPPPGSGLKLGKTAPKKWKTVEVPSGSPSPEKMTPSPLPKASPQKGTAGMGDLLEQLRRRFDKNPAGE